MLLANDENKYKLLQIITAFTLSKILSFNTTIYYLIRDRSAYNGCSFYYEATEMDIFINLLISWGDNIFEDFWPHIIVLYSFWIASPTFNAQDDVNTTFNRRIFLYQLGVIKFEKNKKKKKKKIGGELNGEQSQSYTIPNLSSYSPFHDNLEENLLKNFVEEEQPSNTLGFMQKIDDNFLNNDEIANNKQLGKQKKDKIRNFEKRQKTTIYE